MFSLPTTPKAVPPAVELHRLRMDYGLTQLQAGWIVNVSGQTWNNWENGLHPMPLALFELWLHKTARARSLGISVPLAWKQEHPTTRRLRRKQLPPGLWE